MVSRPVKPHRERACPVSTPYDIPSDPAKRHSAALTDGPDRAGARAMLKAVGFDDADLAKPLIGVCTTWIETMPCNLNQRALAPHVKRGIREAGGTPMEFNTIAVSDGVSMGTSGMKASLVSRETIADSIELVARGPLFDGLVCLIACDKTIPAAVACGGQFTANTMATALEFLGISPAGQNDIPALDRSKEAASEEAGRLAVDLVRRDVRPSQIVTKASLENAAASIAATGGSTNGVLHLVAIAKELDIDFTIDDFDAISARTPIVADLKPFGRFVATDVHAAGGVALVARELVKSDLVD